MRKNISILVGNLNLDHNYLITTVLKRSNYFWEPFHEKGCVRDGGRYWKGGFIRRFACIARKIFRLSLSDRNPLCIAIILVCNQIFFMCVALSILFYTFIFCLYSEFLDYLVVHDYSKLNTSYLTESYIGFTLKMESVTKYTIFGLKMMVKSGLEKIILKSLHAGRWLFLLLNLWFCALLWSKGK